MAIKEFNIDFMGYRKVAAILSLVVVLGSALTLLVNQLNWGLDFTGGTLVEVESVGHRLDKISSLKYHRNELYHGPFGL